jgi:hypothetical protein
MKKNDRLFNKAVEKLKQAGSKASVALNEVSEACMSLKDVSLSTDGLQATSINIDEMHAAPIMPLTGNLTGTINISKEQLETAVEKALDEWIWVKGYKGTDRDMKCRDYQFMFNYRHDMVDGAEIKLCNSGFHFCPKLKDVFGYYEIKDGHRFFEVRALVRKKDYEELKPSTGTINVSFNGTTIPWPTWTNPGALGNDKLTSKAIEFVRELTLDEIFADTEASGWSDEDKKLALEIGIGEATKVRQVTELEALGYSEELSDCVQNCGHHGSYIA